jgi:hypothetical protein
MRSVNELWLWYAAAGVVALFVVWGLVLWLRGKIGGYRRARWLRTASASNLAARCAETVRQWRWEITGPGALLCGSRDRAWTERELLEAIEASSRK